MMSGNVSSQSTSERTVLDDAIAVPKRHAREFARLSPAAKAALVREWIPRVEEIAHRLPRSFSLLAVKA